MECCEEELLLLSKQLFEVTCGKEQRRCNNNNGNYASLCNSLGARERKLVCVTSGNSHFGAHLIKELLSHGFLIRATVQNPGDTVDMERLMGSEVITKLESVVVAKMGSLEALCEAFRGCHVVFHTSSFIDPHGVSGYTEKTAFLEAEAARNVIEACGRAAYVKRCIFTSSLLSSIWNDRNAGKVVDESCWSDEDFCRENRLWLALGKTRAEKVAWSKAKEMTVKLVTICPALVMAPSFPNAHSETSLPYLKGGRLMLERGLLATDDVVRLAKAHVQVYEAMDHGAASGRYLSFERAVESHEEAARLENGLKVHGLLIGFENHWEIPTGRISSARINRLLSQAHGRSSCRCWVRKS